MTQRVAGSFPSYNMQENLFSSISEHDKIVSKYRAAPPVFAPTSDVFESSAALRACEANSGSLENQEQQSENTGFQKSSVALARYKICIDAVDKVAEASMLKSAFIVYRIRFTRTSDLQSHATWKRFKEISSWFQELQQKLPNLATGTVKFPSSGDSWIGGNSSDPASEFVQKRKMELEVFLKTLFAEFPALVRHPSVAEFFELGKLPVETMSVVATRMAARDLQSGSRPTGQSAVYEKSSSSNSSAVSQQGPTQDLSWYTYDDSVMRSILSREIIYDESAARMVKKNETISNVPRKNGGNRGIPSIVEIMTFSDEHNRMQRLRTAM